MKREELRLNENLTAWAVKVSEGNPGAATVIAQALKKYHEEAAVIILFLDDMNIRGAQIWIGYKDYCGCDIDKFIGCIKEKDQAMIEKINEESRKANIPWKAVPHSASVLGREFLD